MRARLLDLAADAIVWFAALSTLNAAAMLVADVVGH